MYTNEKGLCLMENLKIIKNVHLNYFIGHKFYIKNNTTIERTYGALLKFMTVCQKKMFFVIDLQSTI